MKDNSVAAIRSVPAERDPYSGRHIVTLWMTDRNALCDEVDRLRAENAALAAALEDIAGMSPTYGKGTVAWVATAECSNMGTRCCWEHLGQPDGGPDEWCPVCVAEICWSAWKMGMLG